MRELEVNLVEWPPDGRPRLLGWTSDPKIVDLVRIRLAQERESTGSTSEGETPMSHSHRPEAVTTRDDLDLERELDACVIRCASCGHVAGEAPDTYLEEVASYVANQLADDTIGARSLRADVLAALKWARDEVSR
jgi:hypothetical protein